MAPPYRYIRRPEHRDQLESERIAAVIWDAIEVVTHRSQKVTALTGHTIRIATIRVQRDQLPHKPLQASSYSSLCKSWEHLWTQAGQTLGRSVPGHSENPKELPDDNITSKCSNNSDDSIEGTHYATDISRPMTALDRTCLDFCIELLNQQIHVKDYECALLYTLAVQGNGPGG
ncbi:unnamed protein product [Penicillium viridicatum]